MERRGSLKEFEDLLKKSVELSEEDKKVADFFQLFGQVKRAEFENEPCPEGMDCSDLLSNCCESILTTVFGTLPLEVECSSCGKRYLLKEVISQEKDFQRL